MNYVVEVGEREVVVTVAPIGLGRYRVGIEGSELEVDARELGTPGGWSLRMDQRSYRIDVELDPKGTLVWVFGEPVRVEVTDQRRQRLLETREISAHARVDDAIISSPMPGRVVVVRVAEGQTVQSGQGLLVVEAMKMENELLAPRAGVIRNLRVRAGESVEGGVALCVLA